MKQTLKNIGVRRHDGNSYALRCQTDEARFHVWCRAGREPGDTIYKNPLGDLRPSDAGYFPTRHLHAASKSSAAMIAEMIAFADANDLWTQADREYAAAQLAEHIGSIRGSIKHAKEKAGAQLYAALKRIVDYGSPTEGSLITEARAALAAAQPAEDVKAAWLTLYGQAAIDTVMAVEDLTWSGKQVRSELHVPPFNADDDK